MNKWPSNSSPATREKRERVDYFRLNKIAQEYYRTNFPSFIDSGDNIQAALRENFKQVCHAVIGCIHATDKNQFEDIFQSIQSTEAYIKKSIFSILFEYINQAIPEEPYTDALFSQLRDFSPYLEQEPDKDSYIDIFRRSIHRAFTDLRQGFLVKRRALLFAFLLGGTAGYGVESLLSTTEHDVTLQIDPIQEKKDPRGEQEVGTMGETQERKKEREITTVEQEVKTIDDPDWSYKERAERAKISFLRAAKIPIFIPKTSSNADLLEGKLTASGLSQMIAHRINVAIDRLDPDNPQEARMAHYLRQFDTLAFSENLLKIGKASDLIRANLLEAYTPHIFARKLEHALGYSLTGRPGIVIDLDIADQEVLDHVLTHELLHSMVQSSDFESFGIQEGGNEYLTRILHYTAYGPYEKEVYRAYLLKLADPKRFFEAYFRGGEHFKALADKEKKMNAYDLYKDFSQCAPPGNCLENLVEYPVDVKYALLFLYTGIQRGDIVHHNNIKASIEKNLQPFEAFIPSNLKSAYEELIAYSRGESESLSGHSIITAYDAPGLFQKEFFDALKIEGPFSFPDKIMHLNEEASSDEHVIYSLLSQIATFMEKDPKEWLLFMEYLISIFIFISSTIKWKEFKNARYKLANSHIMMGKKLTTALSTSRLAAILRKKEGGLLPSSHLILDFLDLIHAREENLHKEFKLLNDYIGFGHYIAPIPLATHLLIMYSFHSISITVLSFNSFLILFWLTMSFRCRHSMVHFRHRISELQQTVGTPSAPLDIKQIGPSSDITPLHKALQAHLPHDIEAIDTIVNDLYTSMDIDCSSEVLTTVLCNHLERIDLKELYYNCLPKAQRGGGQRTQKRARKRGQREGSQGSEPNLARGLKTGDLTDLAPYHFGDDARHIDAAATARKGEPIVRQRERESGNEQEGDPERYVICVAALLDKTYLQELAKALRKMAQQGRFSPVKEITLVTWCSKKEGYISVSEAMPSKGITDKGAIDFLRLVIDCLKTEVSCRDLKTSQNLKFKLSYYTYKQKPGIPKLGDDSDLSMNHYGKSSDELLKILNQRSHQRGTIKGLVHQPFPFYGDLGSKDLKRTTFIGFSKPRKRDRRKGV